MPLAASLPSPSLPFQFRRELICQRRQIGGEDCWVIKDPLRLTYFVYPEEDFFLLSSIDGSSSLLELQERYQQRFGRPLSPDWFQSRASMFLRDGLISVSSLAEAERLFRGGRGRGRRWLSGLTQPLAIRLPGWDPTPLLEVIRPWTGWLVRSWVPVAVAFTALAALFLVLANAAEVVRRLPLATEFFSGSNIAALLVCLAVCKVLHELGHAITCDRLGAECHEVGVLFLVFMPCLYCDVTDAWMIRNKWHRIAIASAGILVEVFLASLFTFVWWLSEPGFLHNLSLNVMFVCGVGSILFNGNPLLRYDGYFILADWLEIPNLWSRSRNVLNRGVLVFLWGVEGLPPLESAVRRRAGWLTIYGISSVVYRVLIILAILYFVYSILATVHLQVVGVVFGGVVFFGAFVAPLVRHVQEVGVMVRQGHLRRGRFATRGVIVLALLIALFVIPLPCRITLPGYVELAAAERVFVTTPGRLQTAVTAGEQVGRDEELARIGNPELRQELEEARGQWNQARSRLASWQALRSWDESFGHRIPAERETVRELESRVAQLEQRVALLSVRAPCGGTVYPPRPIPKSPGDRELSTWFGSPLDRENRGAFLEKGTLLCLVGDPDRLDGYAIVHQDIVDLVQAGQPAKVQVGGSPRRRYAGRVEQVAPLLELELPPDLLDLVRHRFARELAARDADGGALYLARVAFEGEYPAAINFETARIRISVKPRSLVSRAARYLKRTFSALAD